MAGVVRGGFWVGVCFRGLCGLTGCVGVARFRTCAAALEELGAVCVGATVDWLCCGGAAGVVTGDVDAADVWAGPLGGTRCGAFRCEGTCVAVRAGFGVAACVVRELTTEPVVVWCAGRRAV